ncbi:MAG: sugar transporter permease YjfF [Verrucomicrobiales bacterium]|nr:sugar transporter permease YjfF [Verrucomicrobiales bacterium]
MNLRAIKRNIPFVATASVCLLLFLFASLRYKGFLKLPYLLGFISDDAYLGIAAIGLTFVILTGGIDLSVGGVIGLTSISLALLVEKHHMNPMYAIPLVLVGGVLFGTLMGCLIHFYLLPPFLVTLAGMFLVRGLAFVFNQESIQLTDQMLGGHSASHSLIVFNSTIKIPLANTSIPGTTLIYFVIFLIALVVAQFTKFGRNVYALGGNEHSAALMGLPVARTKIGVYVISSLCSTLAGIVHLLYNVKGDPTSGTGLELDAIAAVVIGGTLLSGGVGYIAGTIIGVLILSIIQAIINFEGSLNSWWTRIAIGMLLLLFILLQKLIQAKKFKTAGTFQKT